MKHKKQNKKAFTLIEILIVIVLLVGLMALVAPNIIGKGDKAKNDITCIQMKNIASTLKMYKIDNSSYPTTSEGLSLLVSAKYFEDGKLPKDSWKKDFIYTSNNDGFEIISFGADKKEGGGDDIFYTKCLDK
jgi:general secretion pathway protein G